MTQLTSQAGPPKSGIDWQMVRYSVERLQFLDQGINWWLLLLAKLAEPMLIFGVVYVGIKLYIPTIATSLPWLENSWIVTQSIALDISGPGAFVLAKQAAAEGSRARARWATALGIILIVLAIVTVSSAAIEHTFNIAESRLGGLVVVLLIVRSAVSVGYSVVCRLHLSEAGEDPQAKVVKAARVLAQLEGTEQRLETIAALVRNSETMTEQRTRVMSEQFGQAATHFGERLSQLEANTQECLRSLEEHAELRMQSMTDTLDDLDRRGQQALEEMATGLQAGLGEHIEVRFSPLSRALPALFERLEQIEETTQGQLHLLDEIRQDKVPFAPQGKILPNVTELRSRTESALRRQPTSAPTMSVERAANSRPNSDGDKGAFVRQCLTDDPDIRNADIGRKGAELGLIISPSYISETRKAFFAEQGAQRSASVEEGSA